MNEPGRQTRTLTLDGLRGIAVLGVVVEHAWPSALPGGFAGVDIFFVLSGYLITRILVAELDATGRFDPWRFYARRVRRILPASLLTVAVTCLGYLALMGAGIPITLRVEALAATFSVSNIYFAREAVDYFASAPASSPFLHYWSLAVEEQFYLVWPGLLLLLVWLSRRVHRPWASTLPLVAVGVIGIGSLALALRWNVVTAFFMLPSRGWELIVGGLFAWVQHRGHARLPVALRPYRWAGVMTAYTLLGITFAAAPSLGRWPGLATILPVAGAALLVAGGDAMPGARILVTRPLQFFGRISYALYLWHWPLLAGAALLALPAETTAAWASLVAVVLAIGIATASTILFEEPIRSSRRPSMLGRPAVARGLVAMMVVGVTVVGLTGPARTALAAGDPVGRAVAQARKDRERLKRDHCSTNQLSDTLHTCVYGAAAAPDGGPGRRESGDGPVVVLFGDSHAMHWFNAVDAWAREAGLPLVVLTRLNCTPIDAPMASGDSKPDALCTSWRKKALAEIERLDPQLTIVSGSVGTKMLIDGQVTRPRLNGVAAWKAPAERMLRQVTAASQATVLIGDVPRAGFNVPDCLAAHRFDVGTCHRRRSTVQPQAMIDAERSVADAVGIPWFDPTLTLCPGEVCTWYVGDAIGWEDEQHITTHAAMAALPSLHPLLDAALAGQPAVSGGG